MNAEIEGKLIVVEMIAMGALGIVLASAGNDPDGSKSRATLDFIRHLIASSCDERQVSDDVRAAAMHHGDDLLSQALENLAFLQGRKPR